VASSHDHGVGYIELIAAGSRSHKIFKLFSDSKKVSSMIKLAASATSGCAEICDPEPRTLNL
jgi:hypothetical protein